MTGWEEIHLVGPHKPVRASFSVPLCKGNDIPSSKKQKQKKPCPNITMPMLEKYVPLGGVLDV